jgi:hypothetical protein
MVKLHEDPERTTSLGTARYAYEFLEAALAVDDVVGHKDGYEIIAPIPVLYLVGHSIELSLKAFLLHKGVSLTELKRGYGHDLHSCMRKAKELQLNGIVEFNQQELGAFEILDKLYSSKQLEYIVTGAKQFPVFGPLQTFAVKLFNAIAPIVGFNKHF